MADERNKPHPVDGRIILYRMARQVAAIVAIVFLLKLLVADILPVHGNQMAPTVRSSDRVLMLRLPYLPVVNGLGSRTRGTPVIFTMPFSRSLGCLRVAGLSGDTVEINEGVFRNSRAFVRSIGVSDTVSRRETMPAEFSPRDYIDPYRIPAPGDTLRLDSAADPYAFCFAVSVLRQDNPKAAVEIIPHVSFNDTLENDYFISGFKFYTGRIDSIPDSLRNDWFFWKRFIDYLQQSVPDRKSELSFECRMDGIKISRYVVQNRYLFLLADNWSRGYDSRYFGPVRVTSLVGQPLMVLWSSSREEGQKPRLNVKRLGRFIR